MGDVGTASGDIHLEAPDGSIYYSGADITISKFSIGFDLLAGFEIDLSEDIALRLDAGFRLCSKPEWRYFVNDEGGSTSSELPASGFGENPPMLDMNGGIFKFSLLYNINL